MSKSKLAAVSLAMMGLVASGCGWTNVPPGEVGIVVDYYGHQKGVQDFPLRTGVVLYNPMTKSVIEYATFMQQVKWTQSSSEGSKNDDSFTANTKEGVSVNFDVALGYHVEAAKVPALYMEFRTDEETMTDTYIRNAVRDEFSRQISKMGYMDVYGTGKAELEKTVKAELESQIGRKGIHVDYVTIIGSVRMPHNVVEAINQAIEATQQATRAQNIVIQKEAEAKQLVAEADGKAAANVAEAQGEAKARLVKAQAEADANVLVAKSLTPELVQYIVANGWNGTLPTYMMGSGAVPMIQLPMASKTDK